MTTYYIRYPNDFANEYTVYAVSNAEDAVALGLTDEDRCNRQTAIERGYSRPRQAKQFGEQWYGGFVSGPSQVYVHDVSSAIAAAIDNTAVAAAEARAYC